MLRLRPRILLLTMILATSSVAITACKKQAPGLARKPYLQSMTSSSVIIAWKTGNKETGQVNFGATNALGQSVTESKSRDNHHVTLTGLSPATTYFYEVGNASGSLSQVYQFTTAPANTVSDFTFVAIGDSGSGSSEQKRLAQRLENETFDFWVHTGDIVYDAGAKKDFQPKFFDPYENILAEKTLFPSPGNHDQYLFGVGYKDAFHTPANNPAKSELYYSFEWGDAKFVSINTNVTPSLMSSKQIDWIRAELTSNTKRWLIVFFHIPLYSSGSHGSNSTLQNRLGALFETSGVDLVLTGHDHHYERSKPLKDHNTDPAYKGLVHILTGGGGKSLRSVSAKSFAAFAQSAYHYTKLRVSSTAINGEAIDIDGNVIDAFTIQK
ncbi:MAG: metallophosphoesterase family protein [Planctomycetota bacterium]|nr:metallophosphoesterase family protein [Planctomycetota bacterium]